MSVAFGRARALMAVIAAAVSAGNVSLLGVNTGYQSRGHGEGCRGNKHARSSFKQNKRRGL